MRNEVDDDRDLYERFVEGDLDAFETLFRRYETEVYGWVYRIVRRQAEAEELTVETFWQIYRARARFSPARGFGPWARRIATNLALNRLRTLGRYEPFPAEPAAPSTADPAERHAAQRLACVVVSTRRAAHVAPEHVRQDARDIGLLERLGARDRVDGARWPT